MNATSQLDIDFLYWEDCPSHEQALARLREVLAEEGLEASIHVTRVETDTEAHELGFIGSPTLRVNGKDIDPSPEDTQPALTCRAYRLENGRISPLPSAEMIRSALRAVVKNP